MLVHRWHNAHLGRNHVVGSRSDALITVLQRLSCCKSPSHGCSCDAAELHPWILIFVTASPPPQDVLAVLLLPPTLTAHLLTWVEIQSGACHAAANAAIAMIDYKAQSIGPGICISASRPLLEPRTRPSSPASVSETLQHLSAPVVYRYAAHFAACM